jgi:hypothetical protein
VSEHNIKIWPEYFQAVLDGTKTFEVRKDDRGYQVGDTLVMQEWKKEPFPSFNGDYTGREIRRTVTYILSGMEWGLHPTTVVMGIQRDVGAYKAHYDDPTLWSSYATIFEVVKHLRIHGLSDDDILDVVKRQLLFADTERVSGGDAK